MKVLPTAIEGVVILEPEVFGDARGYFFESYSQRRFDAEVRPVRFVQDNESHSRYGVLRGLHFQKGRYSQSKLVRVVRGRVLDVAVDIRRGSPTFGRHVAVELTEDNKRQFFIPRGFAHGFAVLSDEATFHGTTLRWASTGVWPPKMSSSRPRTAPIRCCRRPGSCSTIIRTIIVYDDFIFCISVPSVIQTNNTSLLDISDGFLLQVQKEPTISVVRIRLPPPR